MTGQHGLGPGCSASRPGSPPGHASTGTPSGSARAACVGARGSAPSRAAPWAVGPDPAPPRVRGPERRLWRAGPWRLRCTCVVSSPGPAATVGISAIAPPWWAITLPHVLPSPPPPFLFPCPSLPNTQPQTPAPPPQPHPPSDSDTILELEKNSNSDSLILTIVWGVGAWRGGDWEFGISRCKRLYTEWINKVLLYSTGNYIQYPVINHNGKKNSNLLL